MGGHSVGIGDEVDQCNYLCCIKLTNGEQDICVEHVDCGKVNDLI